MKNRLKDMTPDELKGFFSGIGEKPFRASQVFKWMYAGVGDFSEMTNIPAELRARLSETAELYTLKIANALKSSVDDAGKYVFETLDGNFIESALMKYRYGYSICVSSQAGCRMGCVFCASGMKGLRRNLTAGEMADQMILAGADIGEKIGHIVIMGTGEPLDNFEQVKRFVEIVGDDGGLKVGRRHITISTCGLLPGIRRLADELPQVGLAVSLHSADDAVRSSLVPINKKYPLSELMKTVREHIKKTGRRASFEYALIKGINDSETSAKKLVALLRGMNCHVNLIIMNHVSGLDFSGSSRKDAEAFRGVLEASGIQSTIRREIGRDINAACGQLILNSV
jgi:23S rRNA (adenine2503-C2)-methyltransferase